MTKIEKQMIGAVLVMCSGIAVGAVCIKHAISNAGGVKQIIIDAGKEIKEISQEINKES